MMRRLLVRRLCMYCLTSVARDVPPSVDELPIQHSATIGQGFNIGYLAD